MMSVAGAAAQTAGSQITDRWFFTMLPPEQGLGCTLAARPTQGGPGLVLLSWASEPGGPLSFIVMGMNRPVPRNVTFHARWSSGEDAVQAPAHRYGFDGVRFPISRETDPDRRSARFLTAPASRVVVTFPDGAPLLDIGLGPAAPAILHMWALCVRNPARFPPGMVMQDHGPVEAQPAQ